MRRFDFESLHGRLTNLSTAKQAAFAALVCERLLTNYVAFVKVSKWGNPEVLRSGLDQVWRFAASTAAPVKQIATQIGELEAVTPNTEDFDNALVSAALDAASAVRQSLLFCLEPDPRKVAEVAGFARDTVDMHLQARADIQAAGTGLEERIVADPLMQRELERQEADLERLVAADFTTSAAIERLALLARSEARSSLT